MKSRNLQFLYNIGLIFLSITLFIISFPRSWSLYPLGAFLLVGLILWIINFKTNWDTFMFKWYLMFPPLIFFLVQFINSIINASPAILLENQLMFLLIPVLGFPLFSSPQLKSNDRKIFLSFIFGILIIVLFLVLRSIYIVFSNKDNLNFYDYLKIHISSLLSDGFSLFEHPSYLSIKILWTIILVLLIPKDLTIIKSLRVIMILIFSLSIFLLSSKAGMIAWMIIISIYLLSFLKNERTHNILILIIVSFFILLTLTIIKTNVRTNLYLDKVKNNLKAEKVDFKNLDQRTREWYTAFQLIKEKPVAGFGIARVEEKMVEMFRKNGFNEEADLNLNAHNQFLETQMTFGIAGTLSLFWMLLTPLIFRKRLRFNRLVFPFVGLTAFFLLFESMFNRQWGIMFFVLFYCIIVTQKKEEMDPNQVPE